MTKRFIVLLFIILSILLGCGFKTESNIESESLSIDTSDTGKDEKNNLSELEETFSNFDYNSIINEQVTNGVAVRMAVLYLSTGGG